MKTFTRIGAVALCLAATFTGAAVVHARGSEANARQGCKDVRVRAALAKNIRADGTSCRGARRLATEFSEWMIDHDASPTHRAGYHFGRYTCTAKKAGNRRWRIRCRDDEVSVSFAWRRVE
jgi:hypothetical protein